MGLSFMVCLCNYCSGVTSFWVVLQSINHEECTRFHFSFGNSTNKPIFFWCDHASKPIGLQSQGKLRKIYGRWRVREFCRLLKAKLSLRFHIGVLLAAKFVWSKLIPSMLGSYQMVKQCHLGTQHCHIAHI